MSLVALDTLRQRAPGRRPRVALVLGSGWGGLTQHLRDPQCVPYAELAGFPAATVAGHSGQLWLGHLGAHEVAVMSGRQHGYETGAVDGMATPLHVLHAWGCEVLVLTNAAGSLHTDLPAYSLMLLSDHLNLPQRSPLVGTTGNARFVNMQDAYDPALRALAHEVAGAHAVALHDGVYAWALGPQFETPAEVRLFRQMGADAVGMSTVPETILARHLGMRVLAVSLITNLGAGLSAEPLSHAHTLAQAQRSGDAACAWLADTVRQMSLST